MARKAGKVTGGIIGGGSAVGGIGAFFAGMSGPQIAAALAALGPAGMVGGLVVLAIGTAAATGGGVTIGHQFDK